jgi:hypothetical protein
VCALQHILLTHALHGVQAPPLPRLSDALVEFDVHDKNFTFDIAAAYADKVNTAARSVPAGSSTACPT